MTEAQFEQKSETGLQKYAVAAEEARLLQEPKEPLTIEERRKELNELLTIIPMTSRRDKEAKEEIITRLIRFLGTDPLSDQQAGVIARGLTWLNVAYYEDRDKKPYLSLSPEEGQEIHVGDWGAIKDIFSLHPERRLCWERAEEKVTEGEEPVKVYRGMDFERQDIESIRRHGLVPIGLHTFTTKESLLDNMLIGVMGDGDRNDVLWGLPISKTNILAHTWRTDYDFAFHDPLKLAISTTTEENLRKKTGGFFGRYMVEIQLPAERIIPTATAGEPGDTEDERTVLFYIPPEAIIGVYELPQDSILSVLLKNYGDTKSVWEQVQEIKRREKRKGVISSFIKGPFRR